MKKIMNFVGIMVMVALIGVLLVLVAKKDDINEVLNVSGYTVYYLTLQDEFEADGVKGDVYRAATDISARMHASVDEDAKMYVIIDKMAHGEDLGMINNMGYKFGKFMYGIVK